jgi:hypothetical protein
MPVSSRCSALSETRHHPLHQERAVFFDGNRPGDESAECTAPGPHPAASAQPAVWKTASARPRQPRHLARSWLFPRRHRPPAQAERDQITMVLSGYADPMTLFGVYFARAKEDVTHDPTAVALATTTRAGFPSVRMVLLKAIDERGLVFFTNYDSRKGHELHQNPQAAMCFYWPRIEVQVRAEGAVEKLSAKRTRMRTLTVEPGSVRLGRGPRSRARRCHRERSCSKESPRWSLASTVSRFRARRAGAASCSCRSGWSSGKETTRSPARSAGLRANGRSLADLAAVPVVAVSRARLPLEHAARRRGTFCAFCRCHKDTDHCGRPWDLGE